ncbi:MAG: DUF4221 family protein [Nitritalea sp.]
MKKIGQLNLPLDDESTGRNTYTDFVLIDGVPHLSFLNKKNNSIYFYDLVSEALTEKIKFPKNGPNNFGGIVGYTFINLDSIFVYAYNSGKLTFTDHTNELKKSYRVHHDQLEVKPMPGSLNKMQLLDNILIFNGWGSEKEYHKNAAFHKDSFFFLHVLKDSVFTDIKYPDMYTNGIWGVQYFQIYHDVNPSKNELIICYPIDNKIYIYDILSGTIKAEKIKGAPELIVSPLSKDKSKISVQLMEEIQHVKSQSSYAGIKYFSDKGVYLRFVDLPIQEDILFSGDIFKISFGPSKIQVISNDFNFIGEVNIDENYNLSSLFFHDGKIYIEKIQFENEDLLIYDIFELNFM